MSVGDRRIRLAAAAFALAVAAAGCSHAAPPKRPANQARVPIVTARHGTVTPQSSLGGLIVPLQNVQIQSTLSEPADTVSVQEGDHVHKGQVLAVLDTQDLRAELQSYLGTAASSAAKAQSTYLQAGLTVTQNNNSINSGQASVKQAQQTLATDSLNLQRDQQLLRSGYVAQQTVDQQRTLVVNDQQAVRSALVTLQNTESQVQANGSTSTGLQGANVASARADEQTAIGLANQTRAMIAKATIVSPIDGVVVNRNLNPGEYPGTRQIFTLQETDSVYAVLNGSGAQVIGVRTGSQAKIVSSDRATVHGIAKVIAVLDQLTPGSTNFVIKAVLPNPRDDFHPGMVVVGNVRQPSSSGVRIPRTAFVDDTQSTVQTISGGTVKTLPVTLVAEDDKNAIVQGLTPGERVISNGQLGLADGQPVQPLDKSAKTKTVAER
jgi:multidrug efflux pump subunit AcrA (membrane-fusion protein)